MMFYLIEDIDFEDVVVVYVFGFVKVVKFYFVGVMINFVLGVMNFDKVKFVFVKMVEIGFFFCIYGEVIYNYVDIFDCEVVFIDEVFDLICCENLDLKVVMEYIIIFIVVDYVKVNDKNFGVMIIMYYLIINCNYIFVGGIKLYYYCLFVVKCEEYCIVLCVVVILGDKCFFFGIDFVFYVDVVKEIGCGCVGCFIVINIMVFFVYVFEEDGVFDKFEGFVLLNGFVFYGLFVNSGIFILIKLDIVIQFFDKIYGGDGFVIVFDPGFLVYWDVI